MGGGRAHLLKGRRNVVTAGKIVGFQEGIIDGVLTGPEGAEYYSLLEEDL